MSLQCIKRNFFICIPQMLKNLRIYINFSLFILGHNDEFTTSRLYCLSGNILPSSRFPGISDGRQKHSSIAGCPDKLRNTRGIARSISWAYMDPMCIEVHISVSALTIGSNLFASCPPPIPISLYVPRIYSASLGACSR